MPEATAPDWVLRALAPFLESHEIRRSAALTEWRFASRYFSSQIYFTVKFDEAPAARFVAKFPKVRRSRGATHLAPRNPEDIELAALEFRALETLANTWRTNEVRFIQPRFYDAASGLLVFPFVLGTDLHSGPLARQLLVGAPSEDLLKTLHTLGEALARYHGNVRAMGPYDVSKTKARIEGCAARLGVKVPAWAQRPEVSAVPLVSGIRGFEIRSVRTGEGKIWLFDPGQLRQEPAEADIARFLVSVKLLAWGTPYFVMATRSAPMEATFLSGYTTHGKIDRDMLRLLILREISWNWDQSVEVTRGKSLPRAVKALLQRVYVDPGFRRLWRDVTRDE